jgi:hypothetical protein
VLWFGRARAYDPLPAEIVGSLLDSALPGVGPLAKRVGESIAGEWRRNLSTALRSAERISGLSREDLAEAIATVPGLIPLSVRLLWVAGMNGHEEILRGMGATLGHAAREPNRIGEAELIFAAMADLGPLHRRILEVMEIPLPPGKGWLIDTIRERVDMPDSIIGLCVSALAARGLVGMSGGYGGGMVYTPTPLGHVVLEAIREAAAESKGSE